MGNVTPIAAKKEPNEQLVSDLRRLLERAESGDLVAGAFAVVDRSVTVTTCYTDGVKRFALLGGISYLKHRLLNSIDDND